MTDEARDWKEYLAWTSHAAPREYELTERLAWKRLQEALISRRSGSVGLGQDELPSMVFEPAEGFPGDFAPEGGNDR